MENTTNSQEIKKDLVNDLARIESENSEKTGSTLVDTVDSKPFVVPDYILDRFQAAPNKIQKIILCGQLNSAQKKAVAHIFEANAEQIKINREMMKYFIERMVRRYPSLEKVFTEEAYFFIHYAAVTMEQNELVKLELEKAGLLSETK